jgi:aarF domain-containing kinase
MILLLAPFQMEGKRQPQLILVDAGMVAELVPEERENFIGLLHAMGDGDGVAAARCVLKFSASQSCVGNAADDFERDMVAMFAVTCRGYHTNVDVGTVLRGVLKLVRIHGVRISTSYATLVINVLCLDGLATALLPEYNIMDGSKPLMRAHHFCGRGVGNRAWLLRLVVHMASRRKNRRDRHLLTSQTSRGDHHTY